MRIEVSGEVMNLSQELQFPLDELSDASAQYLADAYKYYVVVTNSVDEGELLYSIHVEEGASGGSERTKYVVASSNHAKVIELGWSERAQGQLSYPGRFPGAKAVEFLIEGLASGRVVDALAWRLGK